MSENAVDIEGVFKPKKSQNPSTPPLRPTPYRLIDDPYGTSAQQLSKDLHPGLSEAQKKQIIEARIREREQGKVERITDLRKVLEDLFDIKDPKNEKKYRSLIDSTVAYTEQLMPLLSLIGGSPDDPREGRGVYHKVEVGGHEITVYVKGSGNKDFLSPERHAGPFPGYPETPDEVLYDRMSPVAPGHRLKGIESASWANIEFINSCIVFAETAKREGWHDISQAIGKVSIPIGALHFPELTQKMRDLVKKREHIALTEDEKRFIEKAGRFAGLGVVGAIVPSDTRKWSEDEGERFKEEVENTALAAAIGRTLRRFFDIGIVYNYVSSHAQNFYGSQDKENAKKVIVAGADFSGTNFLGDYPSLDERELLIYLQLVRDVGLVPPSLPRVNDHRIGIPYFKYSAIPFVAIEKGQQAFWEELLQGIAHPDAIRQLPRLMPLFREYINLAVAKLFGQRSLPQSEVNREMRDKEESEREGASAHWETVAEKRRRLVNIDNKFGSGEKLERAIASGVHPWFLETYKTWTNSGPEGVDALGISSMLEFLQTGDMSVLKDDPRLRPYLDLTGAIFDISDKKIRDSLIESLGQLQMAREHIFEGNNKDIIELFDNKHISLIHKLIRSHYPGHNKEANEVIKILTELQKWRYIEMNITADEYPSTRYALQLLQMYQIPDKSWSRSRRMMHYLRKFGLGKVRVEVIHDHVEELTSLFNFIERVEQSAVAVESLPQIDINKFAADRGVAKPSILIANIVGSWVRKNIDKQISEPMSGSRTFFYSFSKVYLDKLQSLENETNEQPEDVVVGWLERSVREMQQKFPEIILGHNLIMASYFSTRDAEKAREYFDKATAYYQTTYKERQEEFGIDLASTSMYPAKFSDEQRTRFMELAEMYRRLGFPKVADFYQS